MGPNARTKSDQIGTKSEPNRNQRGHQEVVGAFGVPERLSGVLPLLSGPSSLAEWRVRWVGPPWGYLAPERGPDLSLVGG